MCISGGYPRSKWQMGLDCEDWTAKNTSYLGGAFDPKLQRMSSVWGVPQTLVGTLGSLSDIVLRTTTKNDTFELRITMWTLLFVPEKVYDHDCGMNTNEEDTE